MKKSKTNEHIAGCNIAPIAICGTKSAKHLSTNCSTKSLQPSSILCGTMLTLTLCLGAIFSSTTVSAEGGNTNTDIVDQINITVPVSCTMSGAGMNTHNADIANGIYAPDIGTTTLHAFCNDSEGFSIYAAGYTGNEIGATNSNKLVGTSASGNSVIESGTATSAGSPDVSNWAMKLAISQDSGDTTTNAFTIDSAPNVDLPSQAEQGATSVPFSSYHIVPNEYTKVAHKNSLTEMTASTGGVKLTTTYAAYISKTQPADTYSGQVKYTLVHPSSVVAGKLNVTYDANGLTFTNGKPTNLVAYNATSTASKEEVTKKSYANAYNENGEYSSISIPAPAGNRVVTIDGADSIHIAVTYGVPQNNGGPGSDLSIWAGNHPEYTNADVGSALTSCGSTSAANGAFSTNGSAGTQVTMECDITGDSVTFYDYSTTTNNSYSVGYYAVVTGEGDVTAYAKTVDSGTYATPVTTAGINHFYGWSTNPNANAEAEAPLYADEADFISHAPLVNDDHYITLYAVWGKTFNAAYSDAGKSQQGNYYTMQDATDAICKEIYVSATETLIDSRDNTTYMAGRLKDGNCWMLDNLALDPTNPTTASNMNATNTNATTEAITNYLNGGNPGSNTGWSSTAVANITSGFGSFIDPLINNASKNTLVTSYGPASTNGQAKVGIYYNYCAATAGTYCYAGSNQSNHGVDKPDTIIDADQDICPANWRMPTGGLSGEYAALYNGYSTTMDATDTASLQYSLSTPLSGYFINSSAGGQGSYGYFWSSTFYNGGNMHYLYVNPTGVSPTINYNRNIGNSIRCLVGD
ncbi:hypothetical protein IKF04_00930 [Candidatus Saccharibacteria bacterium]|nr:hypothetical protein [Candidatus Saccharibacteria bacterium]